MNVSKIALRWSPIIVAVTGCTLSFGLFFVFLLRQSPNVALAASGGETVQTNQKVSVEAVVAAPVQKKVVFGIPVRLTIPKIRVDAAVEQVGLALDGSVGVPKGPVNAAWFNRGPHPGNIGSAVITGHYGRWKGGLATVFNNLNQLQPGDKIYMKDAQGVVSTFVVRSLRDYNAAADAMDVFGSTDGRSHLNLITCEGVWNAASKSYPKRLVVFSDKLD